MSGTRQRTVIVGAGMAGLTAGAYLARAGHDVVVLEKNEIPGGLITSFERNGFVFDTGARSILNAGIIKPMLAELGIDIELVPSPVSIGIESEIINITKDAGLVAYHDLLERMYPESKVDIDQIISRIDSIVRDMAILYGIDNPNFRDLKHDKAYLYKEVFPWLGKFIFALGRMNRQSKTPVEATLGDLTSNRALVDIIAQHFFKQTPTFFALGYFYAYSDYIYPKGGTSTIPRALARKIVDRGGSILAGTTVTEVHPSAGFVRDARGNEHRFDHLVWCADLKTLYRSLRTDGLPPKVARGIEQRRKDLATKRGCDSVFSLFVGIDEPVDTFRKISNGHFFYTPSRKGLGELHASTLRSMVDRFETTSREAILSWLDEYCKLTTYEISIPACRDPTLAPAGKTGMVISVLFDYDLMAKVKDAGWYPEFRARVEDCMLDTLSSTVYPGLAGKVMFRTSSTPLTIETTVGSADGAIVGWSFESPLPVEHRLQRLAGSTRTPLPNVFQAGQWVFSPAGIPTAILTGWNAARHVMKRAR